MIEVVIVALMIAAVALAVGEISWRLFELVK